MPFWKKKVPPTAELSDETLENYLALLRSKGWKTTAFWDNHLPFLYSVVANTRTGVSG